MNIQQGDVLLYQTNDEGEIESINGVITMTGGLETMAYLCLFGGNEEDDGSQATERFQYWANFNENEPEKKYRSETQALLKSLPVTSSSLAKLENAAVRDMKSFVTAGIADRITAAASIPGLNKIKLVINIEKNGIITESFKYTENWKAGE